MWKYKQFSEKSSADAQILCKVHWQKTNTKTFESETHVKNQRDSLFALWQSESLLDIYIYFLNFSEIFSSFSYSQAKKIT